jgi:hypothetical protein
MLIKNQVISGDYENRLVDIGGWTASFLIIRKDAITKLAKITKDTVQSYRLISSESEIKGSSFFKRAAVGTLVLGPLGLLAGLTAKEREIYYVKVFFKDGKESIMALDDNYYKILTSSLSIKDTKSQDTSEKLEDLKLIYNDLDLPYSDRKPTKQSIAKQLKESNKQLKESNKKEIEEANARKAKNNKLYLEKSQKLNEMLSEKIIDQDEFVELMSGLLDKYK